jgi:glycosyltransferase involved in cell wall biosynthesis
MRILFVSSLYAPHALGGAEIAVQEQAEHLAARGHSVAVATLDPSPVLRAEALAGVSVWRVPAGNLYFPGVRSSRPAVLRVGWHLIDSLVSDHARELEHVLREHRPDVISVHNIVGFGAGAIRALARHGVPMAMTLHDQAMICVRAYPYTNRRCEGRCMSCTVLRARYVAASSRFTAVIGVSRFVLDETVRHGAFTTTRRRHVLHNPLLRPGRMLGARARPGGAPPVLGYLGTMSDTKGVGRLVDAFERSAAPGSRLLLAGGGEPDYVEALERRLRGTGAQLLGPVPAGAFFGEVDRLVVPSVIDDSFPGVVVEALAAGLPVHGSTRGGIPEVSVDGRRATLFDIDSPDALDAVVAEASLTPSSPRPALDERWVAAQEANVEVWINDCETLLSGLLDPRTDDVRPRRG